MQQKSKATSEVIEEMWAPEDHSCYPHKEGEQIYFLKRKNTSYNRQDMAQVAQGPVPTLRSKLQVSNETLSQVAGSHLPLQHDFRTKDSQNTSSP